MAAQTPGGAVEWRYCIYKPATGPTNGNIAYYLHGRNLSENAWNDDSFYTAMMQGYWQEKQIIPPVVVSVSFGHFWLLTEMGQAEKSGLLPFVRDQVIKEVEAKLPPPKARIVFGESMGGLNSLVLGLSSPGLFKRVGSSCPALYTLSPFVSWGERFDFLKRTGADPKTTFGVIQLAQKFVVDDKEWNQFSPVEQIKKVDASLAPEIYLSCGLYDRYGNFEGAQDFVKTAQQRGFKLQWRPLYGGHCVMDVSSFAEFVGAP